MLSAYETIINRRKLAVCLNLVAAARSGTSASLFVLGGGDTDAENYRWSAKNLSSPNVDIIGQATSPSPPPSIPPNPKTSSVPSYSILHLTYHNHHGIRVETGRRELQQVPLDRRSGHPKKSEGTGSCRCRATKRERIEGFQMGERQATGGQVLG
ncbi:hypothetical protein TWF970_002910 [Orbilia oligospora]|uniref:Uncharacterized protein n=1 Tax=Orbilia oligospora TaxID=2813651 RepID=A0A7C8V7V4_ORBOL|nr:hypothetical protein TWF970_002910 [Orbilia oligospora]